MNKQRAIEILKEGGYLESYSEEEVFHVTSDGNVFLQKHISDAKTHAKKLDTELFSVKRSDVETPVETPLPLTDEDIQNLKAIEESEAQRLLALATEGATAPLVLPENVTIEVVDLVNGAAVEPIATEGATNVEKPKPTKKAK